MQFNHEYWMAIAINLAKTNNKKEIPVSALIVKDAKLISKAVNQVEEFKDSTLHAEMIAMREASKTLENWRLDGCIIYTTLEPCLMCAGAIINSRISKIVFGAYDAVLGACGSKLNAFTYLEKKNKPEIIGGIMEEEASKLLKDFFVNVRKKSLS